MVVGFVTDAKSGRLVGMDVLVQRDSDGFVKWLEGYVSRFGVESMVTDDLNTYKPVVGRLGVDHQVCIAHVRKWVWNRLRETDGWDWCRSRIWRLMIELPRGADESCSTWSLAFVENRSFTDWWWSYVRSGGL